MRKATLLMATLGLWGCASAEVFRSSTNTYPKVPQNEVLLFFDEADIKVPYELVGTILMGGSSGWGVDCNDLIKKAQKKAGEMGANAILAMDCAKPGGGARVSAALFGTQDNKASVKALRLKPEGSSSEP